MDKKPPERAQTPLDHFLTSTKPSTSSLNSTSTSKKELIKPKLSRPRPYESLAEATKYIKDKPAIEGGIREYNQAIRKTLGKEDCPVTNSTAYSRTLHVQSCATGHQGGGGRSGGKWTLHRNQKLRIQAAEKVTESLKGVVGYISGYTGNETTNTELKACVERQGGQMLTMASGRCTHIFITSNLSGSKAQKYLESKKKNRYKLVLPEWAMECERVGKRVSESRFIAPIKHEAQESAFTIYASTTSKAPSTSTSAASLLDQPPRVPSTSSLAVPDPPRLSQEDQSNEKGSQSDELIVLSPSPNQQTKERKSTSTPRSKPESPRKKRSNRSSKYEEYSRLEKGKEKEVEKLEEILILGSSDVEVEDDRVASVVEGTMSRRMVQAEEVEEEEEEQLDDFGMPPSAQRRR